MCVLLIPYADISSLVASSSNPIHANAAISADKQALPRPRNQGSVCVAKIPRI
jgi:hypothetical protein